MKSLRDEDFMRLALQEACKAYDKQEVPVGAVLVKDSRVIASAHNLRETRKDPTAHAEMLCIKKASAICGTWRLCEASIYCTLEPCAMCAGAIVNARIKRVVYGAPDPKSGACESVIQLLDMEALNHSAESSGGVMAEEGLELLRKFFKTKRNP